MAPGAWAEPASWRKGLSAAGGGELKEAPRQLALQLAPPARSSNFSQVLPDVDFGA